MVPQVSGYDLACRRHAAGGEDRAGAIGVAEGRRNSMKRGPETHDDNASSDAGLSNTSRHCSPDAGIPGIENSARIAFGVMLIFVCVSRNDFVRAAHPGMPDPLVMNDGTPVATMQQWRARRE